ncbi:MAG: TlpA family protein disulfide reductase [Marinilabiliaceae bacterium]|nr:TlpA family protein disulfide reductase [Marinilabiliaceae bacterium]
MKTIRIFVISIVVLVGIQISGFSAPVDSIRIFGNAPEYKGMSLVLETIKNYVTNEKSEIGRIRVDKNGFFDDYFYVAFAQKCFLDLGKVRAYVYLEPGNNYQVVLPPYIPKSEAERFNPFFEPEEVVLGIKNVDSGSLNEMIRNFDERFKYEFSSNAYELFNRGSVVKADEIKAELDSLFPSRNGSYFHTHKTFRYARLYMLAMKRKRRTVIYNFFSHNPIEFNMPAYWETYSEMFKDFFTYYFNTSTGRLLKTAIGHNQSFNSLSLVLSADTIFSQSDFRESVLLKGLYDSYFSGRYSEETVLNLVEQATSNGGSQQICHFASEILYRLNHLRIGSVAPDFKVLGIDGQEISLDKYKGKFLYLSFVHTENYACKKDMQVLDVISKQFKKEINVLTVVLDNNQEKGFSFFKTNKYNWDISHYAENGKILLDYNIRILPVYYLIDPEGKLVLSPAPAPEESFMNYFSDTYRKYKQNEARSRKEKGRSIFDL